MSFGNSRTTELSVSDNPSLTHFLLTPDADPEVAKSTGWLNNRIVSVTEGASFLGSLFGNTLQAYLISLHKQVEDTFPSMYTR